MWRYVTLIRHAFWKAFRHGAFMTSKGAAYSAILTVFPALIVLAWLLAQTGSTATFIEEISNALGVLPPGSRSTALNYFNRHARPMKEFYTAFSIMVLAASGVMISWMSFFRAAYGIAVNPWGFWRERAVALLLVVLAMAPMAFAMGLVAFGNQIEVFLLNNYWIPKFYILLLWSAMRWVIAAATSITCIMLIYHWGLPRVQPWYRALPGAIMATVLWFPVTLAFGWYVTNYAAYNIIYGSLGTGIALLVWLYLISIIVLTGAEYNALVYPREVPPRTLDERRGEDRRRGGDRRLPGATDSILESELPTVKVYTGRSPRSS